MALSKYSVKSKRFIFTSPEDDGFINILHGSIRSSKTWTMIPKLVYQLNRYDVPAGDCVIFGVSKDTIYHNVLNQLFDFVGKNNYGYNRQTGKLNILGKEWTVIGAKDEGSEKYIRGRTIAIAYGDEITLTPKSFMNMLLSRMSSDGARFYGTTNPDNPFHYINVDYLTDTKKIASGMVRSWQFNLDDNLSLSTAKKEEYNNLFKGVFHDRMIKGLWVMAEGAVYKDSISVNQDPAICGENEYDDTTVPIGLKNSGGYSMMYVPIDYGTGNPTVFLLVIDDGETYWIDREYYWDSRSDDTGFRQKTDREYVTDLEQFLAEFAPEGAQCIVDPSAASLKAEMTQRGIWHGDADNEVEDGIRVVSSLLYQRKIKIHKRCKKTLAELQTYSWNPKKQIVGEDAVIKQNDHTCDAIRYFAYTIVPKWRIGTA